VDFIREQQLLLEPTRPRVVLLARDVDPAEPSRVVPLVSGPRGIDPGAPPAAWINEPAAALYGWREGDVIALPLAGRSIAFTIAGVWRDYARQQGAIVIERSRYVTLTGDRTASNAAIWVAPEASVQQVQEALARTLPAAGQLELALPDEIRRASLRAFDRTFAVTYALELAAVLIGLVGLSSAFGALVLARRREFGMLRHLGMLRRQIAFMLASEGLLVSGIGMLVGVSLGWVMSLVLIHVVNRQSFHWGMELSMPWFGLFVMVALVLALSMATAVVSGRAAMSAEAIRAVRDDW
jgi:putative ABC transport system permease protein